MEFGDSTGRIGASITVLPGQRNSIGRPTESNNFYCSQSLNPQLKNIHGLDLGLHAHLSEMCSLAIMWVLNNWDRSYLKGITYTVICSSSWDALSGLTGRALHRLEWPGWENTKEDPHLLKGEREGGWRKDCGEGVTGRG